MTKSLRSLLFRYMLGVIAVTAVIRIVVWTGYQAYEVKQDHVVLHEQINEILLLILVEVISLAVLGFMLWGLSRKLLSPIRSVANAAKVIAGGQLRKRIRLGHLPPGELSEIAETLNASFDQYQDAIDRLSQFSSAASHQLRTPLTAIRTQAELSLSEQGSAEDRAQTLLSILEEVRHLSRMTEQLLLLSRLEIEHLRENFKNVDLTAIARKVIELYQPLLDEKRIRLEQKLAVRGVARGDETLLMEAVTNLFDNACKWSKSGGVIRIEILEDQRETTLTIRDSGPGLDASVREHLFQRFHRHPAAPYKGSGLGLSIVSEVARLHGGKVELGDGSQAGAAFRLVLPSHN